MRREHGRNAQKAFRARNDAPTRPSSVICSTSSTLVSVVVRCTGVRATRRGLSQPSRCTRRKFQISGACRARPNATTSAEHRGFAFAQGRLCRLNPRTSATLLGAAGFVVLFLVPQIKYPANPPAVGSPDTIGIRTGFYFALIALSIAASVVALGIGRRLVARFGGWNAALTSVAIYVVTMAVVMLPLPTIDEVPTEFSPTVLWNFRVATIGIHVVLWTTLGVAFGALTERHIPRARQAALG